MNRSYLLFQLYGPLVSWGDIAVGDERPSFNRPSKSAVMGIIAAALGYRRPHRDMQEEECRKLEAEHQALADNVSFALRLETGGIYMKDYHTIQAPKKVKYLPTRTLELRQAEVGSKESHREYYADQFAIVCLWKGSSASPSLHDITTELERPTFTLYLGRKSCPLALPLMPYVDQEAENWKDALDRAAIKYRLRLDRLLGRPQQKKHDGAPLQDDSIRYFWEGSDHAGFEGNHIKVERWDQPSSRTRWQFQPRREFMKTLERNRRPS